MTDQRSLTHLNEHNQPAMVHVGDKAVTRRTAVARARVLFPEEVCAACKDGEIQTRKGPVFQTAIVAGTMAVKRTSDLIPFCHPIPILGCNIDIEWVEDGAADIVCRVETEYRTGVEMEALTGASVAALTVYDMCKALSHEMVISKVELLEKHGGKRDVSRSG